MFTLNCKGRLLTTETPLVMGVINVTPDSFYASSRVSGKEAALKQAEKMLADGADIIDVGAQSTRPHSVLLSSQEEVRRLSGLVGSLARQFPEAIISVDTFYGQVAEECIRAGAAMINDISGGSMDGKMISTVGKLKVPYVCMHMKGTPQDMAAHAHYGDLVAELLDYFIQKMEDCRIAGIEDVVIDPGFGFSKTIAQNLALLGSLAAFKIMGRPLMVGLSRKSTIYKTLKVTAEEALNGTTVLNTIALLNGADILRVHDVREARECVMLCAAYQSRPRAT